MSGDYSSKTVKDIEKEIEAILKMQHNQDDLFRAVVFMGQMDLAKYIYHDKRHQPDTRYVKGKTRKGEVTAFGQALVQLLLLMKARDMDFTEVFSYALEHMKDDEYKARKPENGSDVKGHPVSGGRVIGKAFVVSRKNPVHKAPPESILVMEHADSETAGNLGRAVAVVTDQGGRLCHLALVAREMGMPAIVGTGNATSKIRTGDLIVVDADNGVVTHG